MGLDQDNNFYLISVSILRTSLLDNVWVLEGKLRVSRYQELKGLIPYSPYDLGENGVHPTAKDSYGYHMSKISFLAYFNSCLFTTALEIICAQKDFYITLDIDECSDPELNQCHANAVCNNTEGSHVCRCNSGYQGDGKNCTGENKATPFVSARTYFLIITT